MLKTMCSDENLSAHSHSTFERKDGPSSNILTNVDKVLGKDSFSDSFVSTPSKDCFFDKISQRISFVTLEKTILDQRY